MKKIALLIVVVMLFGCCLTLASCSEESKEPTPVEEAKECVELTMMLDLMFMTLSGSSIQYVDCTFPTVRDLGNNNFKMSGTVRVRDQYGNFHEGTYDAVVEYDAEDDEYDAEIDYGTFRRQ